MINSGDYSDLLPSDDIGDGAAELVLRIVTCIERAEPCMIPKVEDPKPLRKWPRRVVTGCWCVTPYSSIGGSNSTDDQHRVLSRQVARMFVAGRGGFRYFDPTERWD